jgi:hypothetical protein
VGRARLEAWHALDFGCDLELSWAVAREADAVDSDLAWI